MSVLVYVENTAGEFKKSTFEVVSYAREIADRISTNLVALSIGDVSEAALKQLGKFGSEKVLSVQSPKLSVFEAKPYASVLSEAAKFENSTVIVLSNTFNGEAIASALSAKLEAGLVSAAIDLPQTENERFIVKRSVFSTKAFAEVEILTPTKIITLSPNTYRLKEVEKEAEIKVFDPKIPDTEFRLSLKETVKTSDKVSLTEAEIVVSGGRGLKGPENWFLIEELAGALGGAIACSKPVSDAGWRPHEEHVGQTGITISPNLYVAVGISGAIQHLAGVNSSKRILVINKDADAPFFKAADYGIVGDAFEVVPKLIEAIKEFKAKG